MSVQFLDQFGTDLPAGINVSITGGVSTLTGTTDSTGSVAFNLVSGTDYTATFTGTYAPSGSVSFYGNTITASYLTDDSGNVLTDDSGNQLLYETPPTTVVFISGYTTPPANLRVSQIGLEYIQKITPNLRLSQIGLEVVQVAPSPITKLRLSQIGIEIIALTAPPSALRLSSIGVEVIQEVTPANPRVTQAVVKTLASEPSKLRVTQAIIKALSTVTVNSYTVSDFVFRITNLLPKPWFSTEALQPGGVMYVFIYAVAVALSKHKSQQIDYVKNQLRIMTASGLNLDNISRDYLGNTLPRLPNELDASFRRRIIQAIIGPKVTLAAMQAALNLYYQSVFATTYAQRPTALVFDAQSDPTDAAAYGCVPPQFVIRIDYPVTAGSGWILGQKNLGRNTVLYPTVEYLPFDPTFFDPGLMQVVNSIRAEGTMPLYFARVDYY